MHTRHFAQRKIIQSIIFLLIGPSRLTSQNACDPSKTATTELGTRSFVQDRFPVSPNNTVYSPDPLLIPAKWIRAQIRLDKPGDALWRVDVRDQQFRPIDTILPTDFSSQAKFRWTPRIYTPGLFLDIRAADSHDLPQFTVLQYIVMPDQARSTYYSLKIPATPDWQYTDELKTDVTENLDRVRMADAVGLLFSNIPGRGAWSCSGVLVAADLFLTNWHCGGPMGTQDEDMWTPEIQEDAFIDLSWDGDQVSRELRVVDVPSKSKALDYALLRVKALDHIPMPIPAAIRESPLKENEPVVLIHHPDSDRKAISVCNVAELEIPGLADS